MRAFAAVFFVLIALPAAAQTDTLRAGGDPARSWTLPAAYGELGSDQATGPLAFPTQNAAFATRYAVRFDPTQSGALDGVRLWTESLGFGRLAQQNSTLRENEAPRFQWPIPFDHNPGAFERQAVRFEGTGDDLLGLRLGVGDRTVFGADDSLRVSFLASEFQVSDVQSYATADPATTPSGSADSIAVRFTAPANGLLYGFDLDLDDTISPTADSRLDVTLVAPQTVPPTEVRYYLDGSSFTFALGISGDARQSYGVRFTAPGESGGPPAPLESAEFYVFNINDSRFFTGFDTPANDSLVVTVFATDAAGLPTTTLATKTLAFAQLRQVAFNRVDFSESGVEVAPGEDIVIGFETKVVDGSDIVSLISGGAPDPAIERTLVRTNAGWTTVFDSPFYSGRLDRADEIRVRAFFTDPASGGPSASANALGRGALPIAPGNEPPYRVVLDRGIDVLAGDEIWMILSAQDYAIQYSLFTPASPRRFATPDGVGGWMYVADAIPDIRAVYGEGELPSGVGRLAEDIVVALRDVVPPPPPEGRLVGAPRRNIGFADAPVQTVDGEDYWVVFDVLDRTDDDLDATFALVSSEPASTQTNQSAAFVTTGDESSWTFVQNTLFAQPYEFDVTAYYDGIAEALDDDLVLSIHAVGTDAPGSLGEPGARLAQMRLPLREIGDPNTDFAGFVNVPTFRLRYNAAVGTPFFLTVGLEPRGGFDALSLGADIVDRPAGPAGSSFGYVEGLGWRALTDGGFTSRLTAEALVNTGRIVGVDTEERLAEFRLAAPYPNPLRAGDAATLAFALPTATRVSATVYDVLGREVARLAEDAAFDAGAQQIAWTAAVAPGVYLVRLRAGDAVQTARIVVTR